MRIGVVIMIQTLPMPLLHKIAGLELSDVRITLAGTIITLKGLDLIHLWLGNLISRI
jgi:hypothetical protein